MIWYSGLGQINLWMLGNWRPKAESHSQDGRTSCQTYSLAASCLTDPINPTAAIIIIVQWWAALLEFLHGNRHHAFHTSTAARSHRFLFVLRILRSCSDAIIQSLICSVMASQSFSAAEFVYSSDVVIQTVSPDDRGLNHEVAAASHTSRQHQLHLVSLTTSPIHRCLCFHIKLHPIWQKAQPQVSLSRDRKRGCSATSWLAQTSLALDGNAGTAGVLK